MEYTNYNKINNMFKFNLLESRAKKPEFGELTQEILDENFEIKIDPEKIEKLELINPENIPENESKYIWPTKAEELRQNVLNEIFDKERQSKMIESASEDREGRKVRYYRLMKWKDFVSLLKNGEQTSLSYIPEEEGEGDESNSQNLKRVLLRYLNSEYDIHRLDDYGKELDQLSLSELIKTIFPSANRREVEKLSTNPTYKDIKNFVNDNFSNKLKKRIHTGSSQMKSTGYLSASVGGVIQSYLSKNIVYLELIMPDDKVEIHPESVRGEKEVLLRKIKLANISRVYLADQMHTEIIHNPETILGQYNLKNKDQARKNGQTITELWRWNEPTKDFLPKYFEGREADQGY